MRYLSLVLLFALSVVAGAQAQTPEAVVQSFVNAINKKDFEAAAHLVSGGSVGAFLKEPPGTSKGWPTLSISDVATAVVGDVALVSFQLHSTETAPAHAVAEHLVLVKAGSDWLIEPPIKEEGVAFMAWMLSNPPIFAQAHVAAEATACLSNVKQLSLGVLMLENDNDDVLKVTAANWTQKIMPYLKGQNLLTCPADAKGAISYGINVKLIGKSATAISEPANTVLIYEGKDGKLNFRHGGRAAVAFADGHAKLVTQENAKTLVWNP